MPNNFSRGKFIFLDYNLTDRLSSTLLFFTLVVKNPLAHAALKKLPEIAKELDVAFVLEGSVRKYGNQVRIVAQLIEAAEDRNLWASNFDRELELSDIFTIQSEVAFKIANALKLEISR